MKMITRNLSQPPFTARGQRVLSLVVAGLSLCALNAQAAGPLYQSAVIADGPLGYYRFNDSSNRPNINVNSGSLGSTGNATNLNTHPVNETPIHGVHRAATYFD